MDCSPPGSPVLGILRARILEWDVMSSSRGSFWTRDRTCTSHVSCIGRQVLYLLCHLGSWQQHEAIRRKLSPFFCILLIALYVPSWQEWAEFHSVAQSCLTLRPHGLQHARLPCSSPLPELAQTHVHWISDAIQPSHLLSSPSPLAFSLSKHKGLFQGVSSSHQVAKVLEFQLQRQFFQWIFWKNIGWLRLTSLISLQSKGLSRISMVVLFQIALLSFFPCNYHMRKCEQVWEYLVSLGRMCELTDS